MNTEYLLTVKDGRLGKARQIRPFKVGYIGRPGDLDELVEVAAKHLKRFSGSRHVDLVLELPANTSTIYANVYCDRSQTPIGRVKFDHIKEEQA